MINSFSKITYYKMCLKSVSTIKEIRLARENNIFYYHANASCQKGCRAFFHSVQLVLLVLSSVFQITQNYLDSFSVSHEVLRDIKVVIYFTDVLEINFLIPDGYVCIVWCKKSKVEVLFCNKKIDRF